LKTWDVAVIGAGIVGCAIAREMKLRRLEKSVVMLEKRHEETLRESLILEEIVNGMERLTRRVSMFL
jgi:2-polyprenyl-6-methoxyphenol hydroxylase-like FAD-dependent oxidoreductase